MLAQDRTFTEPCLGSNVPPGRHSTGTCDYEARATEKKGTQLSNPGSHALFLGPAGPNCVATDASFQIMTCLGARLSPGSHERY